MKIPSRIQLNLTCGSSDYFRQGGTDHRKSLPTMLNIAKKIVLQSFYCGDDHKLISYWDAVSFQRDLSRHDEGIPVPMNGGWEFPYLLVYAEAPFHPAETVLQAFLPEFKSELLKFGIDPKAYACDVLQWDLDVDPDDSASHDFMEDEDGFDNNESGEEEHKFEFS